MQQYEITRAVADTRRLVVDRYVYPELGIHIAAHLDDNADRYAAADTTETLAELVTTDLQALNGDRHLRLKYQAEPIPDLPGGQAGDAVFARLAAESMGGIGRIERLDGNIGLLAIAPALFAAALVGDAISAAMRIAATASALVLDLRGCKGGDPQTVALLCSHLFDEPTHLNDIYERHPDGNTTTQYWTVPYVPGERFGATKPVYVLTSATTFSGGEELAYDLQQLGRATLIGERTGGGAHPRIGVRVHAHLEASIPTARSVHPVTGTNWEGTGVLPDIEVPAADALTTALDAARTRAEPSRVPA